MKVALLLPGIGIDGNISTPVLNTLVRYLSARVDLRVFPVRHPSGESAAQIDGATVHPVRASNLRLRRLILETVQRVRCEHQREHFDVIHGIWLFEPGALAVASSLTLNVPSVVSVGGAELVHLPDISYGGLQTVRGRLVQRQVLERATVATGGSCYVQELARSLYRGRVAVERMPLPVDAATFIPGERRLLPDPAAPHLLHAASLIPVKDQGTLLRAFALVQRQYPGARLSIAGEDPFGHRLELERLTARLGLNHGVTFLGAVLHHQMPALYQSADLFVLSSLHESQCMVVLEAAACGVPTVGTSVGVIPELAPDAAVAVRRRSPDALADAIVRTLRSPATLRQMGAQARACAETGYSGPVAVNRILDVYRLAIERHGR